MAEAPKENPVHLLLFVVGGTIALAIVWFMTGGPSRADLRGLFLAPPPPVGPGNAYGPQVGTTSDYYNQQYGSQ